MGLTRTGNKIYLISIIFTAVHVLLGGISSVSERPRLDDFKVDSFTRSFSFLFPSCYTPWQTVPTHVQLVPSWDAVFMSSSVLPANKFLQRTAKSLKMKLKTSSCLCLKHSKNKNSSQNQEKKRYHVFFIHIRQLWLNLVCQCLVNTSLEAERWINGVCGSCIFHWKVCWGVITVIP